MVSDYHGFLEDHSKLSQVTYQKVSLLESFTSL